MQNHVSTQISCYLYVKGQVATSTHAIHSMGLIVFLSENVLRTALSLYMEDEALPLPTLEEVLVCYSNTTAEEV